MCCEDTPCPDQSDVRVLYADYISPDDFMWSVACSTSDLASFLIAPQTWVSCLGTLPDWKAAHHTPVLLNPFNITLSERVLEHDQGSVLIEGISETAIARVVATENSGLLASRRLAHAGSENWASRPAVKNLRDVVEAPGPEDWKKEYWNLFRDALELDKSRPDLIQDVENRTWFGHLRIYDVKWSEIPDFRSLWITAYLLMRLIDPSGYVRTLNELGPIVRGELREGEDVTFVADSNPTFSYNSLDPTREEACDAIFGIFDPLNPTEMDIQDAIVKNYKTPIPPVPPTPPTPPTPPHH